MALLGAGSSTLSFLFSKSLYKVLSPLDSLENNSRPKQWHLKKASWLHVVSNAQKPRTRLELKLEEATAVCTYTAACRRQGQSLE